MSEKACISCGLKIDEELEYCPFCGAAQNNVENISVPEDITSVKLTSSPISLPEGYDVNELTESELKEVDNPNENTIKEETEEIKENINNNSIQPVPEESELETSQDIQEKDELYDEPHNINVGSEEIINTNYDHYYDDIKLVNDIEKRKKLEKKDILKIALLSAAGILVLYLSTFLPYLIFS